MELYISRNITIIILFYL